ncbi:MAG TPA: hypothetical protein VN893_00690 [Bryobacteraceae bacterium]|nr:hypothetical protein [Bryobacteraceae bacterium]
MTRTCAMLLLSIALSTVAIAETLGSVLRSRDVPTNQFSDSDLGAQIDFWAASSSDEPFLLAYYAVDPSQDPLSVVSSSIRLGPLHVVRYDPATRGLRRAEFPKVSARLSFDEIVSCLVGVAAIGERHGMIEIDTHGEPSSGCVMLLSPQLALRTTVAGWPLGWVGPEYAIVQRAELDLTHIAVYDLRREHRTEVYPPVPDAYRGPSSSGRGFGIDLVGQMTVNEAAKVFGFVARYDAGGVGEQTASQVKPLVVAYVYGLRDGRWEHREFLPERLMDLFGVETVGELVKGKPQAAFETLKAPRERPARPERSRPGSLP